ncbi:MAG: hypothetical protein Q7J09_09805 [Methanocalculus sp.]|uniref:hypothetical protein n=1 Tax=Methanocalculus sp. TaxID=2004547 RepID=UPI002723118F|nr:hypothetical protein [Methanocalculus sp.]MDO8842121.1 hypothetical protein [Methanocalculus sp.]MDO9540279.1 hypothetical protein [Methanocalculus sp.]
MDEHLKQYGTWAAVILILLVVAGISWQAGSQAGYSSGFEDGVDSSADVLNSALSGDCHYCLLTCKYEDKTLIECRSDCEASCSNG